MSAKEPLALALARAATRFVAESKVGTRKGSVAAVARAMSERGVEVSSNTLGRKLSGEYPLTTDEIGALAAVLGVDPDAIWRDALQIMHGGALSTRARLEGMVSPAVLEDVAKWAEQARRENEAPQDPPRRGGKGEGGYLSDRLHAARGNFTKVGRRSA